MTDVRHPESRSLILALVFLAIGVLMVGDVADDLESNAGTFHIITEAVVAVFAALAVVALFRTALTARREARALGHDLDAARADADRWRLEAQDALAGLAAAIDGQLERWELTEAERDVALLLLRGLSHKEIADQRATSERTVRQQSLAIYRKANVHSRAELSAFFLRDLPGPGAGFRVSGFRD